ncbi:MAG: hypothetical protein IPK02_07365 [Candidatus Accumulibacter sp.]|uniref:Uncharacterized protein n=1 Tax=Candidatus Accumulibacter affinis TaxID=2954384 RepID=A0A935TAD4_9PROT|nr:hypothetical protein [Candidatus Accumulibacter affinis]
MRSAPGGGGEFLCPCHTGFAGGDGRHLPDRQK